MPTSGGLKGNWGRLDPHPGPLHSAAQNHVWSETQTIKQLASKQFKFNRPKCPKTFSPGCPPTRFSDTPGHPAAESAGDQGHLSYVLLGPSLPPSAPRFCQAPLWMFPASSPSPGPLGAHLCLTPVNNEVVTGPDVMSWPDGNPDPNPPCGRDEPEEPGKAVSTSSSTSVLMKKL